MDFVVVLPKILDKFDSLLVIIDTLTMSAHFIPVKVTYNEVKLFKLYNCEIVRLRRVSISTISDRATEFISNFWRTMQVELGTRLDLSTAFHPQIDRQFERIIQVLKVEVRPWGTNFLKELLEKVKFIQEKFLEAWSRQKEYADRKVRDIEFIGGEQVLLKVSPIKGVVIFGKRVLHVSMLKKSHGDENYIFSWDLVLLDENLSYEKETVPILDREKVFLSSGGPGGVSYWKITAVQDDRQIRWCDLVIGDMQLMPCVESLLDKRGGQAACPTG
ncbi:uncharacterized protein LOC129890724 [Solanum dulcamara]|uniref:uncharacterized protein LOC129890724 n=1 Tax=Solanum dulcamara TaxID=45834 RepID=UPI0024861FEB|nr:uncharacterized protein LOC129890724 [Solanum dulcamara]